MTHTSWVKLKGTYPPIHDVHGPGIDEPLAKFDTSEVPQGRWYYVHADGRGSVTKVTRPDKSVANAYVYDDFGAFRSKSEAVPNPYSFTGRETDVPGLVYYRARYYDSEAGRFLTRDPAGTAGGANRYAYAGNNPVNVRDPSGKRPPAKTGERLWDPWGPVVEISSGITWMDSEGTYFCAPNDINWDCYLSWITAPWTVGLLLGACLAVEYGGLGLCLLGVGLLATIIAGILENCWSSPFGPSCTFCDICNRWVRIR